MNKLPSKLNHMVGTKPAPREAAPPTKPAPREPAAAVGQKPLRKPERVSNREAAVMLGVEERTLADWRRRKVGPEYERLANGHVAYYRHQILDFKQRWEAAPEITGHNGQSKYNQMKLENEKLKKENEKLKIWEKVINSQRVNEETKKILLENNSLKSKIDKIKKIFTENEDYLTLIYQNEVNEKNIKIKNIKNLSNIEIKNQLLMLYLEL